MKIDPVKTQSVAQPGKTRAREAKPETKQTARDSFKPEQKERLMTLLKSQPDVRPEVVERAKALAADPSYPSDKVIAKLAKMFIKDSAK
jgi:hypothetical protein